MDSNKFRKIENEAGYPCYIDEITGRQQNDHPQFATIMESLEEYTGIKYSAYRIAFKVFALQKKLKVPALRISSGVFSRHQLSLSECSLSLDTAELEAVLADIYFAAEKEGLFTGDVDLAVDLLINLLLNVFDKDRKEPIRVLATKTLLIVLSEESVADKWAALANCCADHNGCVSPRRLAALLGHLTALPQFLGDQCDQIQNDVDSCFAKSAGMLGVDARAVAEWGVSCASARWLAAAQRVRLSRNSATASAACAACRQPLIQVVIIEFTRDRKGRSVGEKFLCGSLMPGWLWESYITIGVFTFGGACQQLTAEVTKYTTGRLRPHFYAVCRPVYNTSDPANAQGYIQEYSCSNTEISEYRIAQMRLSFPSAHASFSIYVAVFWILYVQIKGKWRGSKLLRHAMQLAVFLAAWYVGLSRVVEHFHHWEDTAVGFLIGIVYGVLVVPFILKPKKYIPSAWQDTAPQENMLPRPVLAR